MRSARLTVPAHLCAALAILLFSNIAQYWEVKARLGVRVEVEVLQSAAVQ